MPAVAPPRLNRMPWTYVSGLVSALDTRLLTQRATAELLGADELRDLCSRVRQTLMFGDLPESAEPFELAEAMQVSYAAMTRRLGEASPMPSVADVFLLPLEWQAYRGFLRERALGLKLAGASKASVPVSVWEQCWAGPEAEAPYDLFAAAAGALREAAPREEWSPQHVDGVTHVFEARSVRRAALGTGSASIVGWVDAWLTFRLALALLRCRFNQWGAALAVDAFDGLGEARQALAAIADEGRRDWRAPLMSLGLPGVQGIAEDEPLPPVAVERLVDNAMMEQIRAGRGEAFGPEPVFAFLWALRIEALNLKAIVAGRAAGLPREAIAGDLRQTYG